MYNKIHALCQYLEWSLTSIDQLLELMIRTSMHQIHNKLEHKYAITKYSWKKQYNNVSNNICWQQYRVLVLLRPDSIELKHYSDGEVLSVLVQQVKQLNIDKNDHPFKIHIVVVIWPKMLLLKFVSFIRWEYIMLDAY